MTKKEALAKCTKITELCQDLRTVTDLPEGCDSTVADIWEAIDEVENFIRETVPNPPEL